MAGHHIPARGAAGTSPVAQARETYSPLRVSTRTVSPSSMKSGTRTGTPDSTDAGPVPPAPPQPPRRAAAARGGVALHAGLGLRHLHLDRARDLHVTGPLVDEEDLDLAVGEQPAQRLAGDVLGDLELLVV